MKLKSCVLHLSICLAAGTSMPHLPQSSNNDFDATQGWRGRPAMAAPHVRLRVA
jgi:hypothetical protein